MDNNAYLPGTPAQRIRDRLGALNMSQSELARAAGLTEGTLSRILQERTKSIKSQDLVGIANALNVSTDFLLGLTNLPGLVATDASALYARNILDFLKLIINADGALAIQRADEIVAACLVCEGGNVTRRS